MRNVLISLTVCDACAAVLTVVFIKSLGDEMFLLVACIFIPCGPDNNNPVLLLL